MNGQRPTLRAPGVVRAAYAAQAQPLQLQIPRQLKAEQLFEHAIGSDARQRGHGVLLRAEWTRARRCVEQRIRELAFVGGQARTGLKG